MIPRDDTKKKTNKMKIKFFLVLTLHCPCQNGSSFRTFAKKKKKLSIILQLDSKVVMTLSVTFIQPKVISFRAYQLLKQFSRKLHEKSFKDSMDSCS